MQSAASHDDIPATAATRSFMESVAVAYVLLLAVWTLLVHCGVVIGISFNQLFYMAPGVLLISALLWMFWRRAATSGHSEKVVTHAPGRGGGNFSLLWLIAVVPLLVLSGITGNYMLFWFCAAIFLLAAMAFQRPFKPISDSPPQRNRTGPMVVFALCVCGILLTILVHRPDIDDSFYVSVPADAITRPNLPILTYDSMHGDPDLRIHFSAYRVAGIELLGGVAARLLHVEPIIVAHELFPPVFACLAVFAWALLLRCLLPDVWPAALLLTFVLMLAAGERHTSPGNFSFVRFQQGKSALVSIQMPLVYYFAWRFAMLGKWQNGLLLLAAQIGGIGLSSTGILIMPGAAIIAFFSTLAFNRQWFTRACAGMLTCLYPLSAALAIRHGMLQNPALQFSAPISLAQVLPDSLGRLEQFVLLAGLLGGWACMPHFRARKILLLGAVAMFAMPLNPLLTNAIAHHFTSSLTLWRILWVYPWVQTLGAALAALCCFRCPCLFRRPLLVAISAAILFAGCLTHSLITASTNGCFFAVGGLDALPEDYSAARSIAQAAPRELPLLAPEEISVWIATMVHHPPLVCVRNTYLEFLHQQWSEPEFQDRAHLWHLMNGYFQAGDAAYLRHQIDQRRIGSVTLRSGQKGYDDLAAMLQGLGWREIGNGPYQTWTRPGQ